VSSAAARSRFAHWIRGSALQAERTFSYVLRGFQRLDRLPFVWVFGFRTGGALSEPYVFEDFTFRHVQPFRRSVRLDMEIKRDGVLQGVFFFLLI
jgi:hypothetical protein